MLEKQNKMIAISHCFSQNLFILVMAIQKIHFIYLIESIDNELYSIHATDDLTKNVTPSKIKEVLIRIKVRQVE